MLESSQWLGNIVWSTGEKELQESMDKCTACHNMTVIMLKMALIILQSINQSIN